MSFESLAAEVLRVAALPDGARSISAGTGGFPGGPGYYPSYFYGLGGGAKFDHGITASGAPVYLRHGEIRRNSRRAFQESVQARGLIERFADNIAGVGLRLEATPSYQILGISPEEAEAWGNDTEARFDLWAGHKAQNRSETLTWYQSQHLYQVMQHRDNDIFTRLYYTNEPHLVNPLQFEFIDADQIRGDALTSTSFGSLYQDGVVRDKRGRAVMYKVWFRNYDGTYTEREVPARGPQSGKIFMLHGYSKDYAGQERGYSRLSHVLQEFQNVTDFTLAQIGKAISQSQISMFVEPSKEEDASSPFEGIAVSPTFGPAVTEFGAEPQPSDAAQGVTDDSLSPVVSYFEIPEARFSQPGTTGVFNLLKGQKLAPFVNTAPADSYNTFVDSFCTHLAQSSGMPIEVLLMKFGENYSASRATLILFWRVVTMWRERMVSDYCDPCYEMWLSGEVAAGRIKAPGWQNATMRRAWLSCRWIGAPMPEIDPTKTASSVKTFAELGMTTLDRESRNLNGSSGALNRSKLAREYAELPASPFTQRSR